MEVLRLQFGLLFHQFIGSLPAAESAKKVFHAEAQPANGGLPGKNVGIDRNPVKNRIAHSIILIGRLSRFKK